MILGICLLLLIGIAFFVVAYGLSLLGSGGRSLNFRDKIGVILVEGVIADVTDVIDQIDDFADDDGIRAVVVRIDSPGGGVAASQEICQAVLELRKKKKVVASMGSVAASGGYLIASAADTIVANPGTITGSISAVMPFANVEELMKKVGVKSSVIKSGKFKDIGSPTREMTAEEKALLQGVVDDIYRQFVKKVAENRKVPLGKILAIADGRIFSGSQAVDLGLVDTLGGLKDAVAIAGKLAGIEGKPATVFAEKKKTNLWKYLIESMTSAVTSEIRRSRAESRGAQFLYE